MKKWIECIILLLVITIIFTGCSEKTEKKPDREFVKEEMEEEEVDPIMEKLEKMTIDEKIGQLVLVGLDGVELDDKTVELIESYYVGGFILFKKNINSVSQLVELTNSIKSINSKNTIPMFIGVDEEGGRVSRIPKEIIKTPKARDIGLIDDEHFSYEIGKILGNNLSLLGINMDFAPVLDIHSNSKNTVIGDRAFGSTSQIVSKHGLLVMNGIKDSHVIPVVKHFPGHGDTYMDSHVNLPVVNKTKEELEKLEFIPFKEAINNGADVVMIGHILLSNIDEEYPATLSKSLINDILREELKFDGVVVTDDMTMGAITKNFDIGSASVRSLKAGSDIVLVCFEHEKQLKVLNAIREAVNNNDISKDEIDKKVYRILKLKDKYNLKDNEIEVPNVIDVNNRTKELLDKYIK
ncbi:beta-N-acetylhexosaminidase [Anaerosalibacter sp. Marseille-P3206]|uniref:beta-N-acetylhexosaminidase n=1 Tax=Anaerosalibacter sp. Marseille-P3206 TaxID=1871005 RepID=UPI0009842104|nr:beta-N-acetylhexosaminidase [Anaerosalibacter sp. Marseille-P3206]